MKRTVAHDALAVKGLALTATVKTLNREQLPLLSLLLLLLCLLHLGAFEALTNINHIVSVTMCMCRRE